MNPVKSKRIIRSAKLHFNAPQQTVFPLLCPVREYEWIGPWECRMIHTDSGVAELGCVFETDFPMHGGRETWIVIRYAPGEGIGFVRACPSHIIHYMIDLNPGPNQTTDTVWTQTVTPLDHKGEMYVQNLTRKKYKANMDMLAKRMNHFLETNEIMPEG